MTVNSGRGDVAFSAPRIRDELSAPIMQRLAAYLTRTSGVQVDASKTYLVENKLRALVSQNGLSSFSELVGKIESDSFPDLSSEVVQTMTINETHFFRDRVPFESLAAVLPEFARKLRQSRPLRVWSAACSTGQEIYSIAMSLDQEAGKLAGLQSELVATDISAAMITRAAAGLFSRFEVERGLAPQQVQRYFHPEGNDWRIDERLRRQVSFRRHNLLEDFSSFGRFDVVFCRNVLIYFNDSTRRSILERIGRQLRPDGLLILGSAETMLGYDTGYERDPCAPGFLRLSTAQRAPAEPMGQGRLASARARLG